MSVPSHTHPRTHSPHSHTWCAPSSPHILMQPVHTLPSSPHAHAHSHTGTHLHTHSLDTQPHTRVQPFSSPSHSETAPAAGPALPSLLREGPPPGDHMPRTEDQLCSKVARTWRRSLLPVTVSWGGAGWGRPTAAQPLEDGQSFCPGFEAPRKQEPGVSLEGNKVLEL